MCITEATEGLANIGTDLFIRKGRVQKEINVAPALAVTPPPLQGRSFKIRNVYIESCDVATFFRPRPF